MSEKNILISLVLDRSFWWICHQLADCELCYDMILTRWMFIIPGLMWCCGNCWGPKPPDSKVHGANMGPIWVLLAPDGPHVGPMNLAIRGPSRKIALPIVRHWYWRHLCKLTQGFVEWNRSYRPAAFSEISVQDGLRKDKIIYKRL